MKKRGISLLVALVMLFSLSITGFAAGFSDVGDEYSWAEESIETLSEDGIISGYPDGTFKPGANITKEESIALFSRALGYSDEANSEIVDFAKETYSAIMENYTSYAKDQAAYLIYKEVLTTENIASYMATANKGQVLKRYEAAVMIGKAIGADIWRAENHDYELSYEDAADIPIEATPYVYYVGNKGIMTGMSGNVFAPESGVTRAQVAVMIDRILKSMEYEYISGIITDADADTVEIKTEEGESVKYKVSGKEIVTINGEASRVTELQVGSHAVFTNADGVLYAIDSVMTVPDETIVGIYKGRLTDNTETTVKIADFETGYITSYKLASNAAIKYNGEAGSLSSYAVSDYVQAELKKGEITVINGEPKTSKIENLIVEGIEFSPSVTLKLKNKSNEILTFNVKSNATLRRNSKTVDFSELAIGDDVDITLEYGLVSAVSAIGIDKTVTGTIEEITISKNTSYIIVNTGKESAKYAVARDAEIIVDGKESKLYDLRLGANVEFSATSSTVTKLTVTSASISSQVMGTIKKVELSYGLVVLETENNLGDITEIQIHIKDSLKLYDAGDGRVKTVKDLKAGQRIMAEVAENTGIIEASSVMILK